jgi:hypothetical protein
MSKKNAHPISANNLLENGIYGIDEILEEKR